MRNFNVNRAIANASLIVLEVVKMQKNKEIEQLKSRIAELEQKRRCGKPFMRVEPKNTPILKAMKKKAIASYEKDIREDRRVDLSGFCIRNPRLYVYIAFKTKETLYIDNIN